MLIVHHLWELVLGLVILVGPLPLCLCLVLVNQKQSNNCSFPHRLLVALTGWSVIQVCLGLILGSLHSLTLKAVLGLEIILLTVSSLLFFYLKTTSYRIRLQEFFKLKPSLKRLELFILGSLAFSGLILLEKIATEPITNYDALWFHLPAIARWYQTGSLTLLDPADHWIFEHQDAKLYPYNWHIISTLFILPFGEDFLVAFPHLIAWALLGLSIYLMSVHLGASRLHGMAASSLVLTVPLLANSVNAMQVDLPLAAFFTISLYLAFSYHKSRSSAELALFLASLGMLAGIKTPGIIYAALLGGSLAGLELKDILVNKSSQPLQLKFSSLLNPLVLWGIVSLFFLGSFWYIRDFIEVKNYVAEMADIQVASANLTAVDSGLFNKLSGIQKSTLTHQFKLTNLEHWKILGAQMICRLQIPFLALLGQTIILPLAFIKSKNKVNKKQLITTIVLVITLGFLYWNTPYSSGSPGEIQGEITPLLGFNFRYGFPFLSVLGIGAAVSATALQTSKYLTVVTVLISSVSGMIGSNLFDTFRKESFTGQKIIWGGGLIDLFKKDPGEAWATLLQILGPHLPDLFSEAAIYLGFFVILRCLLLVSINSPVFLKKLQIIIQKSQRLIGIFCIVLLVSATWVAREKRDINRTKYYSGIYEYIETATVPNEKIAYFSSPRNYLFYGKHLDRQVLCVPLKPREISQWLSKIRQTQVNLVGVGPTKTADEKLKKALSSLTGPSEPLRLVFGHDVNNSTVFYRLRE